MKSFYVVSGIVAILVGASIASVETSVAVGNVNKQDQEQSITERAVIALEIIAAGEKK